MPMIIGWGLGWVFPLVIMNDTGSVSRIVEYTGVGTHSAVPLRKGADIMKGITKYVGLDEVGLEIEGDPDLKASIRRAKDDIHMGRVYSTEEAFRLLDEGLDGEPHDSMVA